MALHPECDQAIAEIVNEAIIIDNERYPIEIILDDLELPENIADKIRNEFEGVLKMLDFKKNAYEIFRRFYVDGRLYYHLVIDTKNPKLGILDIRYVDPRKMRKIKEEVKEKDANTGDILVKKYVEYFVYNEEGINDVATALRVAKDSIAFVHSGIIDQKNGMILSNLHKAIKTLNSLTMLESAVVIYRIARAPERRVFYIDVGGLQPTKADQYMQEVMSRVKNKVVYNASTGEIVTDKRFSPMLEDFFLARREGKGTEVTTLQGGQNLGQIEDVEYFQRKLYKALNVPTSRLESDNAFNFGRIGEITRDEVKFNRFILRLRARFNDLFNQVLERQLSLKNIMSAAEWQKARLQVSYDYLEDNHFTELKDAEVWQNRLNQLQTVDPLLGKYFSKEWIFTNVLHLTEDEIEEMEKQIEKEKKEGKIPEQDPMSPFGGPMGSDFGGPPGLGGPPGGPELAAPAPGMPPQLPPPGAQGADDQDQDPRKKKKLKTEEETIAMAQALLAEFNVGKK